MKKHPWFSVLAAVLAVLFAQAWRVLAQDSPAASLQQQLEELRRGQQEILRELQELNRQLHSPTASHAPAAAITPTNGITMNVRGEPYRGVSNAPIALIEYSDFACLFCGRYAREIYPKLDEKYIRTGKLRYFFRDLPAPEHPDSMVLARAARCAGQQGKFWEMHDWLFAMQGSPQATNAQAQSAALSLDPEAFQACLQSDQYSGSIRRSILSAGRAGVYGTSAFLIGRLTPDGGLVRVAKLLVGAEVADELESSLDELLTSAPK